MFFMTRRAPYILCMKILASELSKNGQTVRRFSNSEDGYILNYFIFLPRWLTPHIYRMEGEGKGVDYLVKPWYHEIKQVCSFKVDFLRCYAEFVIVQKAWVFSSCIWSISNPISASSVQPWFVYGLTIKEKLNDKSSNISKKDVTIDKIIEIIY